MSDKTLKQLKDQIAQNDKELRSLRNRKHVIHVGLIINRAIKDIAEAKGDKDALTKAFDNIDKHAEHIVSYCRENL